MWSVRALISSSFQLFVLVVQVRNTGVRSHGYEAKVEPHRTGNSCTAAVRSSPERMCDCMEEFNFNLHNCRQVNQQSVAAKSVSSSSSLPRISCLLAVPQYITWISCVTCMDFSRDLQYWSYWYVFLTWIAVLHAGFYQLRLPMDKVFLYSDKWNAYYN